MPQSIAGVVTALFSSMTTVFAPEVGTDGQPVLVSFGDPGQYQPSAIVAIMEVRSPITRPTMGTNRSRDMVAEVDVTFSVYTPGGEESQQVSTDKALALLSVLETWTRTAPNETVGGVCRDAFVSMVNVVPTVAVDPGSGSPAGRVTEIPATVTVFIRY